MSVLSYLRMGLRAVALPSTKKARNAIHRSHSFVRQLHSHVYGLRLYQRYASYRAVPTFSIHSVHKKSHFRDNKKVLFFFGKFLIPSQAAFCCSEGCFVSFLRLSLVRLNESFLFLSPTDRRAELNGEASGYCSRTRAAILANVSGSERAISAAKSNISAVNFGGRPPLCPVKIPTSPWVLQRCV